MLTPRYFSPVEGHKVNRFGTMSPTSNNALFGCTADPATGTLTWNTEAVLKISPEEAFRFEREYNRLVRDGALVEKTEDDWKAYEAKRLVDQAEAKRGRDAEQAKAAE